MLLGCMEASMLKNVWWQQFFQSVFLRSVPVSSKLCEFILLHADNLFSNYFLKYTPSHFKLCQNVFHKACCQELDPSDALIKALLRLLVLCNTKTHIYNYSASHLAGPFPLQEYQIEWPDLISTKDSRPPSLCHHCTAASFLVWLIPAVTTISWTG